MTAKAPTPMPEGMNRENRPKAPAAPPRKLNTIVTVNIKISPEPKYPVYWFDFWLQFDNQNAYLNWQDSLRKQC